MTFEDALTGNESMHLKTETAKPDVRSSSFFLNSSFSSALHIPLAHSVIRPFGYSPIRLFAYSVIQLFGYSVISQSNCR